MYNFNRNKEQETLMHEYMIWKTKNFNNNEGFFPVFKNFEKFFPVLSTGAISLYVFFGIHSKNRTGDSFYSINSIAKIFGKSTRTISFWISELEMNGLIVRKQKSKNNVSITFLRPY